MVPGKGDRAVPGRAGSVLLVEDNPITRKLLRVTLEIAGYDVADAPDGQTALELAAARRPDLLIFDFTLPDTDGLKLLADVRRQLGAPDLPAIIITGMVSRLKEMRANAGSATYFLAKPVAPSQLLGLVRAQIAPRPGRTRGQAIPGPLEQEATGDDTELRQAAIQAAALSIMRGLSDVLAKPRDATQILSDVLVHSLDAAGLSTGLLYMTEPGGEHRLKAHFGIPADRKADAEVLFGHPELIRRIGEAGKTVALSSGAGNATKEARDFLRRLGSASVLVLPLVALGETLGALLLASESQDLSDARWIAFAQSLALQFGQTVALGQSLERLSESEGRYRALADQANDAILVLDSTARVIEVNRATEHLLGRPRAEIVGRPYLDFVAPEELADAAQVQEELLAAGTLRVPSRRMMRADGTRVTTELSSSVVTLGSESAVLTILRDVTERRAAEEAHRRSDARMKSVLDAALDAVIMMDEHGRIASWNARAETLFGWSRDEAVGQTLSELIIPAAYREDDTRGLARFLETGEGPVIGRRVELSAVKRDGSEFPVELTVTALREGGTYVFNAFVADITDRKRAARDLEQRMELAAFAADVGASLVGNEPLPIVLQLCAEAMMRHLEPAFARIWTLDATGDTLELQASAGQYTHLDGAHARVPVGKFKIGLIAAERRPHLTNDVQNDARVSDQAWARREGMVGFAGYPLVVGDHLVGVMAMFARHPIAKTVFDAMAAVANQIALGIERKSAEEALKRAQRRLEHVVSSSPAVLFTLVPQSGALPATWISENVERLLGYTSREALDGGWWPSHLHPEDKERIFAEQPGLFTQDHLTQEYRFQHQDGAYRWLRAELRLLRDSAGKPQEVVGSWSDVTPRKEAELKLTESEEQYRILFDNNPHPMWVYDQETFAFLAVNEAALHHYGYTRDEFLTMTVLDIRPPEDVAAFKSEYAAHREAHADAPFYSAHTSRHRKKDGSVIEVDIAASSIVFGGRAARLLLATDVTEKLNLERQLARSQKMEAVGQLAGGVAHDFNNLLGVITGYTELLIRALPAESVERKRGEEIKRAADRAAALTRQLLAFGRRQVLQATVVDLNEIVPEVEKMLRRLISESIQIVFRAAPVLGKIRADAGQIEQVLMNLAINARDAMPSGGHLVIETGNVELDETYARTNPEATPGPHVMLAVTDTGHGMDAQTMSRIFEPFFTTKEDGKGTGLGLATVYGIVRQSGGVVNVYSEPGRGTTFKVYLPRVEGAVEAEARVALAPPAGGTETILLVEDAEALRLLVRELLESAGYKVLDAEAPDKAIALIQSTPGPIHLVLTDMVMPRMSGQEFAKRLAVLRPEARVVFMSGYSDQAVADQGMLEPGTPFLQKPFTLDALIGTIRRTLDAPTGR
jgi:two-component system cell cycle sensor histidine kinase/response regulator CckA